MVGGGIHEARLRAALNGTWRLLAPAFCPFRKTITSEAASSAGGLFYSEISVRCRLMALRVIRCAAIIRSLSEQHGQSVILASDDLSANDPRRTLAVHCGNSFDADFSPYQSPRLSRCSQCHLHP